MVLWPTRKVRMSVTGSWDGEPGVLFSSAFPLAVLTYFWMGLKEGVNWYVGDPSTDPWGERRWRMTIGQTRRALVFRCFIAAGALSVALRLVVWVVASGEFDRGHDEYIIPSMVFSFLIAAATMLFVVDGQHQLRVKKKADRAAKLLAAERRARARSWVR
ncbi:hypothetical protein B0T22DRAFT_190357 [Podospora appendiculata]|uniref:Uncharacterized protein n=1 Tax=Podospora appendiculata TaxID=314037 RepID=A0AAE0XCP7_9PEZI|nr:hypothetical protein B0T22DRAFT_190357 [Podospora appendiculata]